MFDLSDVTFTIPVKIDQPDRIRNLKASIGYLCKHLNTNIIIAEMDTEPKLKEVLKGYSFKYIFMKTASPFFHRTMMLNYMAKKATTPYIVNYDCDVLLMPDSYFQATLKLRNNEADMVYPYDGNFLDTNSNIIPRIVSELDISFIQPDMVKNLRPNADSVGGAVFWNKEKFMQIGLENENFISWGYEDNERFDRAKKLGLRVLRCAHGLYHLKHGSSLNSANGSHPYFKLNELEWLKVNKMSSLELSEYVKTWTWAK